MNWFTKKVPPSALVARLDNQEVAAAREYLNKFLTNAPVDQGRLMQALTLLLVDLDRKDQA